jgi:uncharacterized membrane protein YfcA
MESKPRGVIYHWAANIVFATLAVSAGVLFGERIPRDKFRLWVLIIVLVALLLVPVTRRWERTGIEKRARAAGQHAVNGNADLEPPAES